MAIQDFPGAFADVNYAQRHAAAMTVFESLRGEARGSDEAAATLVREFGAVGSFAIDYVYGDVWARPQLPRQDRCLAVVAFMVAFSLPDDLRVYLNAALNLGFSPSEMDDAMLQAASYGGIPFALAGMRALNDVVRQRSGQTELPARDGAEPKGTAERLAAAAATMLRPRKQVSKDTSAEDDRSRSEENTRRELRGQGSVGTLGMLFSYGEVWPRKQLSARYRRLFNVALLTAQGSVPNVLAGHIRGALAMGMPREQVEEVMVTMAPYGGFPRAVEGYLIAAEQFAYFDGLGK